ncbi:MAG TPA: metal ABC transporter permease [Acidimicrobiales bacterium]|nr:metal ABC transporter permease [Acidimicrobiales bacterium]
MSGFFDNGPVQLALVAGGVVAVVSAVVGVFTVIRGQSFAGHALSDIGTVGGSGAFLAGVSPLWGFVVVNLAGAATMELLGVRRPRGRDVATGIVLGAALGLSALFLYWDTTVHSTTGATVTVLFGSLFTISGNLVAPMVALAVVSLAGMLLLYRPLLLSSLNPDMAAARGVPVRVVGVAFLLVMAVAVSMSSVVVGAILSTALLIGPAATALRLTRRPGPAMAAAAAIGVVATWAGVALAYASYYWPPAGRGWPVSFFVVALVFVFYVAADLARSLWDRRRARRIAATELHVVVPLPPATGATCSPA